MFQLTYVAIFREYNQVSYLVTDILQCQRLRSNAHLKVNYSVLL